eukprot:140096-Pyramimonas_sp.AAC.1
MRSLGQRRPVPPGKQPEKHTRLHCRAGPLEAARWRLPPAGPPQRSASPPPAARGGGSAPSIARGRGPVRERPRKVGQARQ